MTYNIYNIYIYIYNIYDIYIFYIFARFWLTLSHPLEAVDFGVVLGLGWGTAAVLVFWLRGLLWGRWPEAANGVGRRTGEKDMMT